MPKITPPLKAFLATILTIILLTLGFSAGHFAPELATLLPPDSTLADPILRDLETDLSKCTKKLKTTKLKFDSCDLEFRGPKKSTVIRVTDGDTIKLDSNHTVRILGIDTPELSRKGNPAEPFSAEATQFATDHLLNKTIKLESSLIDGNDDHFGRLLRFIWFEDENGEWLLFEEEMIKRGLASVMDVNADMPHVERLKKAEATAKAANLGIWSVK